MTPSDPPLRFSGETLVRLDSQGNLRTFEAVPPKRDQPTGSLPPPDWTALFSETGLEPSEWTPSESQRSPLNYADAQAAWQGTLSGAPSVPILIEAGAYRDRPVSFQIIGPWNRAASKAPAAVQTGERVANGILVLLLLTLMVSGLFFARRNLRLGRGDRRGAARLVSVFVVVMGVSWIFGEHHVPTFWETYLFVREFAGSTLFVCAMAWTLYIALEPYVRRRWPQVLFSWTRLLSGEWRDPLVGRDVLVGCATGVTHACILRLGILAPGWFGYGGDALVTGSGPFRPMSSLGGSGSYISALAFAQVPAFSQAIAFLFLFFFLRILLRNQRVAGVGCALLLAFLYTLQTGGSWASVPIQLLGGILTVYVLLRFGLVSSVVAWSVFVCFFIFPMTLHVSAWYSTIGFATLSAVLALSLYGFWTALGNRPLLDVASAED